MPPTDQEWMAQLPPDQQSEQTEQPAPTGAPQAPSEYAGQVAEIYSGRNVYKLPYSAEFAFPQKGKPTTMPIGKLVNAYGHHLAIQPKYDNLLKEYNTLKPEYDELKGKAGRYGELEKLQAWSEQNPDLFKHIWDGYTNREKLALQQQMGMQSQQPEQASGVNQQMLDVIAGLKGEVGQLREWKTSWEKQQEQLQDDSNVELIEKQISGFKEEFPFIDIDKPDEKGVTLTEQIINFGIQNKIPDFDTAALKYLKPQLLEHIKGQGRSEAVKGIKDNNKKGIVATSNTPFPIDGQSAQPADAKKPDHVLLAEAKAMMEQMKQTSM